MKGRQNLYHDPSARPGATLILSFAKNGSHALHEVQQRGCFGPPGVKAERVDPMKQFTMHALLFDFEEPTAFFSPKEQFRVWLVEENKEMEKELLKKNVLVDVGGGKERVKEEEHLRDKNTL